MGTKMRHQKEINRWARQPDGTKVWQKMGGGNWVGITSPSWYPSEIYIVDDEYAELRMLEIDGAVIQSKLVSQSEYGSCYSKDAEWNEDFEILYNIPVEYYRVKPKEYYDYKFLIKRKNSERNFITRMYYKDETELKKDYKSDIEYFIRIDETKRVTCK
jgi:hypothetical protein